MSLITKDNSFGNSSLDAKQKRKFLCYELIEALRQRYKRAAKREKTRILDEFVAVAGYHRKHAIRMLRGQAGQYPDNPTFGRRIYNEAVVETLIVTWEAADRICSKRLKVVLPDLVEAMERHGHLKLNPEVRHRLLSASAATIDRLLKGVRKPTQEVPYETGGAKAVLIAKVGISSPRYSS